MKKVILSAVLFAATLTVTSCGDKKAEEPATETTTTVDSTVVTEPVADSATAPVADSVTTTEVKTETTTEVKK